MATRPEARMSLLYMPDGKNVELYFWYGGNPFELDENDGYISLKRGIFRYRHAENPAAIEAAKRIKALKYGIGSVAIRPDFMVVGVPRKNWSRASHEIVGFFNAGHQRQQDIMKEVEYSHADKHGTRTEVKRKRVAAKRGNTREEFVASSHRELRYKRMRRDLGAFAQNDLPKLKLKKLK